MMRCVRARVLILQQLRDTLAPGEAAEVERHLERCSACRAERSALATLGDRLSASTPASVTVRPSPALEQAWVQIRSAAVPSSSSVPWLRAPAFRMAAGLAAVGAIWMGTTLRPETPAAFPPTAPAPAAVRAAPGPLPAARKHPDPVGAPRRHTADARAGTPSSPRGPAPATSPSQVSPAPVPPIPDTVYLDGRDPQQLAHWMVGDHRDARVRQWLTRVLPPVQDDFVHVPLPRIASTDRKQPAVAAALRTYEQEAKAVDARLFQKVGLTLKAASLEVLCAELEEKTRVRIRASRVVRDDKVTVLVKDRPAREVMRGVARLFGYTWERTGEPGSYRYELTQDLRSQLAEQEMRDRDLNAAAIALDEAMNARARRAAQDFARLRARREAATGAEQDVLEKLIRYWAHLRIYQLLTPADRAALLRGEHVRFVLGSSNPDRRLPADVYQAVYDELDFGDVIANGIGGPGAQPFIGLSLDRSEMGQAALRATYGGDAGPGPDGRSTWGGMTFGPIAIGQSPSVANPENARHNAALRKHPLLQRLVSLQPRPSCPRFAPQAARANPDDEAHEFHANAQGLLETGPEPPHVVSADVWEAVHRATGLSIIADSFSRWYPAPEFKVQGASLFDALCQSGDRLGVRWKLDGDFILGRSTSYFWGRIKEVPNRHLERWQASVRHSGGLPLEDLLEMSQLSDAQLDSAFSGQVLEHCRGLQEWGIIGAGLRLYGIHHSELRPYARLLAGMSPAQRQLAFRPRGLALEEMPALHQEVLVRLLSRGYSPEDLRGLRLGVEYSPAGAYVWQPVVARSEYDEAQKWPLVAARTPEAALASARKLYPAAQPNQVRRSKGELAVTFWNAGGLLTRFGNGADIRDP